MALTKQTAELAIAGGIDQHADKRLTTRLLELKNMRSAKVGTVTKRYGAKSMGILPEISSLAVTGRPIETPYILAPVGDQIVRSGTRFLHSCAEDAWRREGVMPQILAQVEPCSSPLSAPTGGINAQYVSVDVCRVGYALAVLYNGNNLYTVDIDTGAMLCSIYNTSPLPTKGTGRIAAVGDTVLAVYVDESTDQFNYILVPDINSTAGVTSGTLAFATDAAGQAQFGLGADTTHFFITYRTTAPDIKLKRFDTSLTVTHTAIVIPTAPGAADLDIDGTNVWVIASSTTLVRAACYNASNLAVVLAPTTIRNAALSESSGQLAIKAMTSTSAACVWLDYDVTINLNNAFARTRSITTAGVLGLTRQQYIKRNGDINAYIAHKIFESPTNGRFFVTFGVSSVDALYAYTVMVDLGYGSDISDPSPMSMACSAVPRRVYNMGAQPPCSVVFDDDGNAITFLTNTGRFVIGSIYDLPDTSDSPLFRLKYTSIDYTTRNYCTDDDSIVISGGLPMRYDGAYPVEIGFLHPPLGNDKTANGVGLVAAGTYFYYFVYVYVYSDGRVERSLPSAPLEVVIAAPGVSINLEICKPFISYKNSLLHVNGISIEIYLATPFVLTPRLRTVIPAYDGTSNSYVAWEDDQGSVTENRPALYTISNELDNVNPPTSKYTLTRGSRVYLAGTDDDRIWYSKLVSDIDPPCYNEGLTIDPFQGGRVVGLGTLDDKLIVFKASTLWAITGDGPNNQGQGNSLSDPQQVSTSVGCKTHKSIISTQLGTFFQGTDDTIYLLNRSLQVQGVGMDVQDLTLGYTCTSVINIPTQNHIRFTFVHDESGLGLCLNYDFDVGTWCQYEYQNGPAGWATSGITGACKWNVIDAGAEIGERYTLIFNTGNMAYEDTSSYYDSYLGTNQWVTASLRTSWIKTAGLNGFQRIYRLGMLFERGEDCDIDATISHDFLTSNQQAVGWTRSQLVASDPLNLQIRVERQKSQALQLYWVDSLPSGTAPTTGQGYTITGFEVQYGIKGGLQRVGSLQRR